jgi:GrpB-like predicted nucleotidyltransferase (UPF0157 family)
MALKWKVIFWEGALMKTTRKETLEEKIRRVLRDEIAIEEYNPDWPRWFEKERDHLRADLPADLVGRIEHFGSTAVPGLAAKPVVDMLVAVTCLERTRREIAPILEAQGYDYFWRPTSGDDGPPFYAWFIKRDGAGQRTHHIHMVEPAYPHWDRLLFRDYLILHPKIAAAYGRLKHRLAARHPLDRIAYTEGKTRFISYITERAKGRGRPLSIGEDDVPPFPIK